ncbi:MAG: MerR family transcriptional regulator [Desulfovibrio sp.]|jgi:predicted site-specific integrase-resolvase|nr:MerR family transcriptional regulator [Desulfovibrio sp.]
MELLGNEYTVAYVPIVLTNLREICDRLNVSEGTVKAWIEKGAPIAVEGMGAKTRYSTELAALQAWRNLSGKNRL